jgi:formate/nitrite transporter FocA (FNT family)
VFAIFLTISFFSAASTFSSSFSYPSPDESNLLIILYITVPSIKSCLFGFRKIISAISFRFYAIRILLIDASLFESSAISLSLAPKLSGSYTLKSTASRWAFKSCAPS